MQPIHVDLDINLAGMGIQPRWSESGMGSQIDASSAGAGTQASLRLNDLIRKLDDYGEPLYALERTLSDSNRSENSHFSEMVEWEDFFQTLPCKSESLLIALIRTVVLSIRPTHNTQVLSKLVASLRADTARRVLDSVTDLIPNEEYMTLDSVINALPRDTTPLESHEEFVTPILSAVVQSIPPDELAHLIPSIVQVAPETLASPVVQMALDVLPTSAVAGVIETVIQSIPPGELEHLIPSIVRVTPETLASPVVRMTLDALPASAIPGVIETVVQSIPPDEPRL